MATPVSDIFRPAINAIAVGSFLKYAGASDLYHVALIDGGRAMVVSLGNGNRYKESAPVARYSSINEAEFRAIAGDPNDWSVLSRAEAAAELAKMK